ncbi:MAG: methionine--tRNA ligase, partial [Fimbriimonadaceae bacterium]|nr:methionine--tRNA ligase [Fimbriimonadaceae bacterium]
MAKRYYITTPIYYVNSTPHAGHALTMLMCDVTKRHRAMRGQEVYFLTGTDENGQKITEAAARAGETPQAFVDRISQTFVECARLLNVDYDCFIRTTDEQHRRASQELFALIRDKGYIYEGVYEGWYDVSSETFIRESDLEDGLSPDGNPVVWVSEQNWFFKLSAFEQPLLDHIANNPEFLLPEGRRNEVVSFIKQGLRDMCITRDNLGWGIEVPGDPTKVIYVWFEALINYLAATGWPDSGWEETWPADVHWMAKEIFVRFHATLWPAMLMAAELPLPKTVIAHGWYVFGDAKMSKSLGNVINPEELIGKFERAGCTRELAVDGARWALVRTVPYENDTNFTHAEIDRTFNADLANDLGNALNRSLSMAHKFVGGVMPNSPIEADALEAINSAKTGVVEGFDHQRIDHATDAAIGLVRFLNKYIDQRAPWALN